MLTISLADGTMVVELFEAAAPVAVRRIAALAEQGHYDGQAFSYTIPHFEIISSGAAGAAGAAGAGEAILLENELDAGALGLDKLTIDNIDRAVDTFQLEIFPAFNRNKKKPTTPRMAEWLDTWDRTMRADFLVGVSRQEINEALGYVYRTDLDSRPVSKGAVTLKPVSQTHSTARLSIALRDLPLRTGQHVVIGRLIEGFELADDISIRPLDVPPGQRSFDNRPKNPVVIHTIRLECHQRSTSEGGNT